MKYNGIIYQWYNKISKKSYIGQTRVENRRKNNFLDLNKAYTCWGSKIDNARLKYGLGEDIWERRVLFQYSTDELDALCEKLNEKEIYYINEYDSYENGYNSTLGGDGSILTEEKRNDLSKKGKEWWESLDDEEKKEISLKNRLKGKEWWESLSEEEKKEHKRKSQSGEWWESLSEEEKNRYRLKGKEWWESLDDEEKKEISLKNRLCHEGKPRSNDVKQRLREINLKSKRFCKPVICLDKDGNIIQEFTSINETEKYGFSPKSVSDVLNGHNKTHKGYIWAYKNPHDSIKKEQRHSVYVSRLERYRSRIRVNGKDYGLGYYKLSENANKIYQIALKKKKDGTFNEWFKDIEKHKLEIKSKE